MDGLLSSVFGDGKPATLEERDTDDCCFGRCDCVLLRMSSASSFTRVGACFCCFSFEEFRRGKRRPKPDFSFWCNLDSRLFLSFFPVEVGRDGTSDGLRVPRVSSSSGRFDPLFESAHIMGSGSVFSRRSRSSRSS